MNRRQKIIVSITGIFLVLLALVGLTYAYFLTRITGNKNPTSISVTTANLELVYGDNSEEIINGTGALMPTVETEAKDAIGTKTFTVTNNGNDSSYVVIIDNVETKYATNGSYKDENGNIVTYTKDQETNFVTNDFRYTLTCSVKDKSGNIKTSEKCNDVNSLSVFPINGGILVGNAIPENRVHEYTLTLWYIDNGKNQSNDMNKTYQARINIEDINQMENPYKSGVIDTDTKSLAYNIINNAKTNKNGTRLVNIPETKVAEETSTYGSGKYETKRYYYPSWEDGGYEWSGLTYGATQYLAESDNPPHSIEFGIDSVEACNSVKGQYISDSLFCYYGCSSIGKVVDCESDGTPILEENNDYPSWEDGGYEWSGLTYGATQYLAENAVKPLFIEDGINPVEACNSVKGQYITDSYNCKYGCSFIGKVVDCESDGKPILEDNYYEYNEEIFLHEKVLSTTPDDYGTSYYFRGDVEDNYVTFSNKCWRIVRIQGDGSIKLTLEAHSPCSESMTRNLSIGATAWGEKKENSNHIGDYKNSTSGMKRLLTSWLNATDGDGERTNITTKSENLLKTEEWCLGNTTNTYSIGSSYAPLGTTASENYTSGTSFWYETGRNLYGKGVTPNATLVCNGETDSSKIGALTADEVVFAGGKVELSNYNYYLNNDDYGWWTISRSRCFSNFSTLIDSVFRVESYDGTLKPLEVNYYNQVRPAVSLNTNVKITSGDGTIKNPYIIDEG